MKPAMALIFAFIGVLLMMGIGISMAYGSPWMAVLFSILTIGFMGYSFALKARLRRRQEGQK